MAKKVSLDMVVITIMLLSIIAYQLLFSSTLANVYTGFALAATAIYLYFLIIKEKKILINTTKGNTAKSLSNGLLGMGAVIIIGIVANMIFGKFFGGESFSSVGGYFSMLQSSAPILANSSAFTFYGWGILIPILETMTFGFVFLLYLHSIGQRVDKWKNAKWIGAVLVLSVLFAILHLQAKGLSPAGFISTFVFMVVTLVLISKDKEMESAIWMHIINNSIVVAFSLGWIGTLGI